MAPRSIGIYSSMNKSTASFIEKGRKPRGTSPPRGRFQSSEAYIRYSTLIAKRDILTERGFLTTPSVMSRYPSFLQETLHNMGWMKYAMHPEVFYPRIVREVYSNLPLEPSDTVYFRGKTVDISPNAINELLGVENTKECQFEALIKGKMTEEVYTNIIRCICCEGTKWLTITKGTRHITFDTLLPETKLWYHFVATSLCPTKYTLLVTEEIDALFYYIVNKFHIDVGKVIARKIRANISRHTGMIFPTIIGGLMKGHFEKSLEKWKPVARKMDPIMVRETMMPDATSKERPETDEGIIQQGSPSS